MGGPHAWERHVNSGEPPKVASTAVIGVAMQCSIGIAAALARIKAGAPVVPATTLWRLALSSACCSAQQQ